MTQIGFADNMASALTARGSQPEMKKMLGQWKKRLTKAQRRRFEDLSKLPLAKLKEVAKTTLAADKGLYKTVIPSLKLFDKEALLYFMMDLEYGVIGSMPPEPLKVGAPSKLMGVSIKYGRRTGPVREAIVTAIVPADKKKKGSQTSMAVFVPAEKVVDAVEVDQIIGIGTATVKIAMEKEAPAHAFSDPAKNNGRPSVPADPDDE
jgi:hypothetical protein